MEPVGSKLGSEPKRLLEKTHLFGAGWFKNKCGDFGRATLPDIEGWSCAEGKRAAVPNKMSRTAARRFWRLGEMQAIGTTDLRGKDFHFPNQMIGSLVLANVRARLSTSGPTRCKPRPLFL